MNDEFNSELPAELHEIAQNVDALGAAERATAPAGLEDRVHGASVAGLQPTLKMIPAHERAAVSHTPALRRWLTPLRAAAGIALFTSIGVTYLAVSGRPPVTPPVVAADDIDGWINLAAADDSVAAELDLLIADTERVKERIRTPQPIDGGEM